jgi:ATP-dependent Clp protease ATP-binding subunit ClpA
MTSNVGARDVARRLPGFNFSERHGDTDEAFKRLFSPEFRNRLDAKVDFAPLGEEEMLRIVDKFLVDLGTQLAEQKVTLVATDPARAYLAQKGHDPANGARPLARLIQEEIKRPLADELLFGKLAHGGSVQIGIQGENLTFEYSASPSE